MYGRRRSYPSKTIISGEHLNISKISQTSWRYLKTFWRYLWDVSRCILNRGCLVVSQGTGCILRYLRYYIQEILKISNHEDISETQDIPTQDFLKFGDIIKIIMSGRSLQDATFVFTVYYLHVFHSSEDRNQCSRERLKIGTYHLHFV